MSVRHHIKIYQERSHEAKLQMKYAGIFANDLTFDDFMEKLAVIRKQSNSTGFFSQEICKIFRNFWN
ncbi:hypothetical protein F7734_23895 [Scytonema sp. UIC 10036]|uniref:hypothetical protein n=1 Tax=Scytonema sp. UIC 10036 TaxID=2304196 RepID=UPI0012DA47BC|nr:hypothetical protein [Scytonema sp. UIC 10036]MUG95237.1 hypothetical protein [Scytonema sp. UIC 10036]